MEGGKQDAHHWDHRRLLGLSEALDKLYVYAPFCIGFFLRAAWQHPEPCFLAP